MPQLKPARGSRKRKRKPVCAEPDRASTVCDGVRTPAAAPLEEPAALPPPVGRLERTRRLILAALRVWELRRKIHD